MSADRIYGFHPVREALRSHPESVERVLVAQTRGGKRRDELESSSEAAGVPFEVVPDHHLDAMAPGVHNGFAAEVIRTKPESGGDPDLVVLLEDIQDPRNLGAVLRVCDGAGVSRVLIRDRGSAPLSDVAKKAAAGAAEWIAVERITNTSRAIEDLRQAGYWIYGADAEGEAAWNVDLAGKVALVLGGEGTGMRRLTRERCDALISLPMRGKVESLNVSTAAAGLLFEAVRQRSGTKRS